MELTDIPITLETNENQISATSSENIEKRGSLKRFFKLKKPGISSMPSSTSSGVGLDDPASENLTPMKNSFRKFQIRCGSPKFGAAACTASNAELGTSRLERKSSTTKSLSDSTHRLQGFFSNYWNQVFKKSSTTLTTSDIGESINSSESTMSADDTTTHIVELSKEEDVSPPESPRDIRRSQSPTSGI